MSPRPDTRTCASSRTVLPLDVVLTTTAPVPDPATFVGAFARGVLVSALEFHLCTCGATRHQGTHEDTCPLALLLGGTPGGARRLALSEVALTHADATSTLAFRVLLFGAAAAAADLVVHALDGLLGHGIGTGRTPLAGIRVTRPLAGATLPVYDSADGYFRHPGDAVVLSAPWATGAASGAGQVAPPAWCLTTRSPLDLAWRTIEGRDAADCVSLAGIAGAVVRRWMALAESPTTTDADLARAEAWAATVAALSVTIAEAPTWHTALRVSARQRRRMPLRGVVGAWRVADAPAVRALAPLVPLFPVGARTAFGFGSLALIPTR